MPPEEQHTVKTRAVVSFIARSLGMLWEKAIFVMDATVGSVSLTIPSDRLAVLCRQLGQLLRLLNERGPMPLDSSVPSTLHACKTVISRLVELFMFLSIVDDPIHRRVLTSVMAPESELRDALVFKKRLSDLVTSTEGLNVCKTLVESFLALARQGDAAAPGIGAITDLSAYIHTNCPTLHNDCDRLKEEVKGGGGTDIDSYTILFSCNIPHIPHDMTHTTHMTHIPPL